MNRREQELLEMFIQLEMITRREMMGRFHNSRSSMNPHRGQGRIMGILKMKPEISQKELGFLLDMSKQGLAELLGKLEAAGYITRTPSAEDGRVMMIKLTPLGKEVAEEMDSKENNQDSIFSCLDEEEQKNLKSYLVKMIENAQDRIPDGMARRHRRMYGRMYERNGMNNDWKE